MRSSFSWLSSFFISSLIIIFAVVVVVNGQNNGKEGCRQYRMSPINNIEIFNASIKFVFFINSVAPKAHQQLEFFHAIDCMHPPSSENVESKYFLVGQYGVGIILTQDFDEIYKYMKDNDSPSSEHHLYQMNLCDEFLKSLAMYFEHYGTSFSSNPKNFILFNFNSMDESSCEDEFESYMLRKGLPFSAGIFLNVIHINSTMIPEDEEDLDFQMNHNYFLGQQLSLSSANELDYSLRYRYVLRSLAKNILEQSILFDKEYKKMEANTSLIHMDQTFFNVNESAIVKAKESKFVKGLKIFCNIVIACFIIYCIGEAAGSIGLFALDCMDMVKDNINFELDLIRAIHITAVNVAQNDNYRGNEPNEMNAQDTDELPDAAAAANGEHPGFYNADWYENDVIIEGDYVIDAADDDEHQFSNHTINEMNHDEVVSIASTQPSTIVDLSWE